ncbi:hypothetical protein, partial [Shigella sp. FC1967]|uniref:hypothetical protein n=1 Tax=Shigella sp. FC1967 TaxID=1898041 RepID=UPI001C0A6FCA
KARQTSLPVRLTTPFFRPCIWSLKKCGGQTLRLTGGFAPQNETRSLGFTCHRWGVSFRFGSPCFSLSSLDAHQDKNKKPTALVLLGWSNRFLPQNKF